jgi:L-fucose mutarotase/ribose pyranase (RbsD/FucU family)
MPPFRKRTIIDPRFDGEALHELRDIGHGHRINIVDASYDIPRGARVIKFPGSSADALLGIIRLIPIEDNEVAIMEQDAEFANSPLSHIARRASLAFEQIVDKLPAKNEPELLRRRRLTEEEVLDTPGNVGFYELANRNIEQSLFVRTTDELPFACASLVAGHSQRTS